MSSSEQALRQFLDSVVRIYGIACEVTHANSFANKHYQQRLAAGVPPNTRDFWANTDPTDPAPRFQYSETVENLSLSSSRFGKNDQFAYSMAVVYLFAIWEEETRPAFAKALGKKSEEIVEPIFGDLRKVRNCLLHNNGVMNKKLEVMPWFMAGEVISFDGCFIDLMREVFEGGKRVGGSAGLSVAGYQFDRVPRPKVE